MTRTITAVADLTDAPTVQTMTAQFVVGVVYGRKISMNIKNTGDPAHLQIPRVVTVVIPPVL